MIYQYISPKYECDYIEPTPDTKIRMLVNSELQMPKYQI